MDIRKALLVKSLRELLTNHSLPRSGQQTQATDIQNEKIKISINLPYIEGTSEKLWRILRCHKKDPLSTLKAFCVNSFVNRKIG